MLKNSLSSDEKIEIKFATAYNKFGDGKPWHQANVERMFAREELLIGTEYWNFFVMMKMAFQLYLISIKNRLAILRKRLIELRSFIAKFKIKAEDIK